MSAEHRWQIRIEHILTIPPQAADINVLLEEARQEDILVRAADGAEFMLTAVEDFD
jgi:hypothetical protein